MICLDIVNFLWSSFSLRLIIHSFNFIKLISVKSEILLSNILKFKASFFNLFPLHILQSDFIIYFFAQDFSFLLSEKEY